MLLRRQVVFIDVTAKERRYIAGSVQPYQDAIGLDYLIVEQHLYDFLWRSFSVDISFRIKHRLINDI